MNNQIITNFLLFALVFLVAYCLGLNIINLINKRLENIAIRMPAISVEPQVSVHYDPNTGRFQTLPSTHYHAATETNQWGGSRQTGGGHEQTGGHLLGLKENHPPICGLPPLPTVCTTQPHTPCPGECRSSDSNKQSTCPGECRASTPASSSCKDIKSATSGCEGNSSGCNGDADCNQVYGQGANRCLNGKCECRFGTGKFCHLTPTFYLDPSLMTPAQVIKFKNRAKLQNMTLQDYKNWLGLFESDLNGLAPVHRTNYFKMKRGDPITVIPSAEEANIQDGWQSPGYKVDANGTIEPNITPVDPRMYNIHGGRQLAPAGILPESQDLIQVKLTMPGVEVDSPINYRFIRQDNTTGFINNFAKTVTPLRYSDYEHSFESNRKYIEYKDQVKPFRTMLTSSWYQNQPPLLSQMIGSDFFDPAFRCNT